MYDINNIDQLLEFYGGRRAAERRFEVTRTCIANWRGVRGIPTGWQPEIIFDFIEAGKTFNPALFDAENHRGAHLINQLMKAECAA